MLGKDTIFGFVSRNGDANTALSTTYTNNTTRFLRWAKLGSVLRNIDPSSNLYEPRKMRCIHEFEWKKYKCFTDGEHKEKNAFLLVMAAYNVITRVNFSILINKNIIPITTRIPWNPAVAV